MKKLIGHDIGGYSFDPAAKTVKIFGVSLRQEQLLTITNTTTGNLIYVFADPSLSGALDPSFDGFSLILAYDTAAMHDTDALQIFVDIPVAEAHLDPVNIDGIELWRNPDTGELYTQDVNLQSVLGSERIVEEGKLKTKTLFIDTVKSGRIGAAQEAFGVDCRGCPSVAVQLAGTWAGTITFEGRTDSGTLVAINGMAVNAAALVSTTTAGGIFRFPTAGLVWFQARMSAYTSGTAFATIAASGEPFTPFAQSPLGSQTQLLQQRATTYELNTYDTNLAIALGTAALFRLGFTVAEQVVAPTLNPAQPTTYAGPMYARYPQLFPRLRVEIGGDQKLPLAQDPLNKRLLVETPEIYSMLEQIKFQLQMLNQLTMRINGIEPPTGWEEIT
jgi:hypothetical protein